MQINKTFWCQLGQSSKEKKKKKTKPYSIKILKKKNPNNMYTYKRAHTITI